MLLKLLALFVVEKRFVSIVIKVLQSALLFRLGQVIVGNWDKFIRNRFAVSSVSSGILLCSLCMSLFLSEVLGMDELHADKTSDTTINIVAITIHFLIALSFKAFHPSRYIAFADARTETLAFLPIARACLLGKQFAAFAKSRT